MVGFRIALDLSAYNLYFLLFKKFYMEQIDSERSLDVRRANSVEGPLNYNEGVRLYYLAQRARLGIVEIGSWKGRSTSFLGSGSRSGAGVPVFAVDRFSGSSEQRARVVGGVLDTYPEFVANISRMGLADIVHPVISESIDAASNPVIPDAVDLLFIDGSHDYESVVQDILTWEARLVDGGMIALHDTFSSWADGPRKAAIEKLITSGRYTEPRLTNSLLEMKKSPVANLDNLAKNIRMQIYLQLFGPASSVIPQICIKLRDLGVLRRG